MKKLNEIINEVINQEKISESSFKELKSISKLTGGNRKIIRWFYELQKIEIPGWRTTGINKHICNLLLAEQKLKFYVLLCPSYIKNKKSGFRTDDVGDTTKKAFIMLEYIKNMTEKIGFECENTEVIFFDLALEDPKKNLKKLDDLKKNINNAKKYLLKNMNFSLLSERFPILNDLIGYEGIKFEPLPIDDKTFERIVERGKKFYQLFGWSNKKVIERTKIISSSEYIVGLFLKENIKNGIMVYTPTMLERAQIYLGGEKHDNIPIVFPNKDLF